MHYGDLSAVLLQNTPFWGHWLRTPELSIALSDEWESKIEKLAHTTADENVTSLAGVPTWTLLLLKRILDIKQNLHILLNKFNAILKKFFYTKLMCNDNLMN